MEKIFVLVSELRFFARKHPTLGIINQVCDSYGEVIGYECVPYEDEDEYIEDDSFSNSIN